MQTQYQAVAEPVPQEAEVVTADRWQGSAVTPVLRKRRAAVGCYDRPLEISLTTPVAIDWFREASRPRNPVKKGLPGGATPVLEPTLTTAISIGWHVETGRPRNPKKKLLPEGAFSSPPTDPIEVEQRTGWMPRTEGARPKVKPQQQTPPAIPVSPITTDRPTDWMRATDRPTVRPRRQQPTPDAPFIEAVTYQDDSLWWMPETNRPRARVKGRQHQPFATSLSPPQDADLSLAWLPAMPSAPRRKVRASAGLYVAQLVIDLLGLDWMRETNAPRPSGRRRTIPPPPAFAPTVLEPPAGWLQPVDARTLRRRAALAPATQPARELAPPWPPMGDRPDDRDDVSDASSGQSVSGG